MHAMHAGFQLHAFYWRGLCVASAKRFSERAVPVVNIRPSDRTGRLSISDRAE